MLFYVCLSKFSRVYALSRSVPPRTSTEKGTAESEQVLLIEDNLPDDNKTVKVNKHYPPG